MNNLTIEQVKSLTEKIELGLFKFVNINGEYRFCSLSSQHKELVDKDELPVSAGFFSTDCKEYLKVQNQRSIGLNVGPRTEDELNLKAIFCNQVTGSNPVSVV